MKQSRQKEDIQLGLKRKWQIALRRYLIENNPSVFYAPYFGLTATDLRDWVEAQFYDDMSWDNFGDKWNIIQRVPTSMFDLTNEQDLSLCWHYINISAESTEDIKSEALKKLIYTKVFFEKLFAATGLPKSREMVDKLNKIEVEFEQRSAKLNDFLLARLKQYSQTQDFDSDDFARLNRGEEVENLLIEKEIIKKYGS